ncbi:hypothetical protein PF003_g28519 [Phytophthora fragariae]|nr:hypothetical protein PF003_g28519 [Phytophthora fragariae]
MDLAVALGPHRLRGLQTGTIGQVLPILRLKQLRRDPLINTSVGDDQGLLRSRGGSSRRDMDASKARARSTATTVFGVIGLPG